MHEIASEVLANLRANRLRSVLTMFGIAWGVVSLVVLSAVGEGFQEGNRAVLTEFGRNQSILWGGRTSRQAGGERAGRVITLTVEDARTLARESRLLADISPEIARGNVRLKSRYNTAAATVHGIEPPYQTLRTIDVAEGRRLTWGDEPAGRRVALLGATLATQLFAHRSPVGESMAINGLPYVVVGRLRKKNQSQNYGGMDDDKVFVPFAAMRRDLPHPNVPLGTLSHIVAAPRQSVIDALPRLVTERGRVSDFDGPFGQDLAAVLARRKGFDPEDRTAVSLWDTAMSSLMFGRIISHMREFFLAVSLVTLALGGVGVMNIMLISVTDRTREIGIRRALGATRARIRRQFFFEGLTLTMVSGTWGLTVALVLCHVANRFPRPGRFAGLLVTWRIALLAVAATIIVGVLSAALPARRAAKLTPTEALRHET